MNLILMDYVFIHSNRALSTRSQTPVQPNSNSAVNQNFGQDMGSSTASSSTPIIDLTLQASENQQENYLDFLSNEWVCLHEAYFAALQRKDKKMCSVQQDIEDSQRTASFWNSFQELETQVLHAPNSPMKNIILGLIKRRDLRRGITCNDSDLNQITTNIAMRMFTPADLKLEFEMNARPF